MLVFSPIEKNTLYLGTQYVMKTTDGGLHWEKISPDLTGAAAERCEREAVGPATAAEREGARLWRGVQHRAVAAEGGADLGGQRHRPDPSHPRRRQDLAERHADRRRRLEQDLDDRGFALRSRCGICGRRSPSRSTITQPYLYRTRDYGKTWQPITDRHRRTTVRECDPPGHAEERACFSPERNLGIYVSFDDGDHWQPLQLNLPVTSVRDITVHGDDLVDRDPWALVLDSRQHHAAAAD